jgi:hypothetical protein
MPRVSASSVIAIRLMAKENIRTAPCYFTLHKKALKWLNIFVHLGSIQDPTPCVNPTQQVAASAMFNS